MPVRNAARFVDAAIASILSQSFGALELVILDDASTDSTWERVLAWAERDGRVVPRQSSVHLGPALSSQRVVEESRFPLIARQDADDVSLPSRLSRQIDLFQRFPDTAVVGTLYETIDENGTVVRPRDCGKLFRSKLFSPVPHGSLLFRRVDFETIGGYRQACDHWEDQDLMVRLCQRGSLRVVLDALYRNRVYLGSRAYQVEEAELLQRQQLALRCLHQATQGRDYADLLNGNPPDFCHCLAFYASRAHYLWCGQRPGLLQRLLAHKLFPRSAADCCVWLLALGSEIEPRATRWLLKQFLGASDWLAYRRLKGSSWVEIPYPWDKPKVPDHVQR